MFCFAAYTGCLMKNASTHNFFIYYPISMNKKIEDTVFQALQNSHKIYFFLALSSIANDSQLFFFKWTRSFLGLVW
jgi:UDP-N-acetylglucosamine 2-epimerase